MPKKKRAPKRAARIRPGPTKRPKAKVKRRMNPRRCNMCRGTGKLRKNGKTCAMCKGAGYVGAQRNPGESVAAFKRRMHTTIEINEHEEVAAAEEEEEEEERSAGAPNPTDRQVILSPVDSPSGKIAVHVLDRNHQLVRPLEDGPVTYYSVQKARADCEAAGLEVVSEFSEENPPRRRRRNSSADDAAAQRAHFEKLHWGDPPTGPVKLDCPDYKDASAVLGRLVKVEYVASKGGRTYTWVHKHLAPAYLVVTKRGKLLIGEPEGKKSYIVTAAGIEG
jgi:hypothetical protein